MERWTPQYPHHSSCYHVIALNAPRARLGWDGHFCCWLALRIPLRSDASPAGATPRCERDSPGGRRVGRVWSRGGGLSVVSRCSSSVTSQAQSSAPSAWEKPAPDLSACSSLWRSVSGRTAPSRRCVSCASAQCGRECIVIDHPLGLVPPLVFYPCDCAAFVVRVVVPVVSVIQPISV